MGEKNVLKNLVWGKIIHNFAYINTEGVNMIRNTGTPPPSQSPNNQKIININNAGFRCKRELAGTVMYPPQIINNHINQSIQGYRL
jgi:hypothetical protein